MLEEVASTIRDFLPPWPTIGGVISTKFEHLLLQLEVDGSGDHRKRRTESLRKSYWSGTTKRYDMRMDEFGDYNEKGYRLKTQHTGPGQLITRRIWVG